MNDAWPNFAGAFESAEPPEAETPAPVPADPVERMLVRIRLRAKLRVLWLRSLWRREQAFGARHVVDHAQVDAALEGWDQPAAEADFRRRSEAARRVAGRLAEVEAAMRADGTSRLAALARVFALTEAEFDLLQACLAASLDPALAHAFAYLQDVASRAYATEDLVRSLFGHDRRNALNADSALRRWRLVIEEPVAAGEPKALQCDPVIRAWALGGSELDEGLVGVARPCGPEPPLPRWPVEDTAARLQQRLQTGAVRVVVRGAPGSGRRTLAACVAAKLGLRLLAVDSDAGEADSWPALFLLAQRQAFLDRCALAWFGERARRAPWPQTVAHFPLQFVIADTGDAAPAASGSIDDVIDVPPLIVAEREALWRALAPAAQQWAPGAVAALATRRRASVGEIAALARRPLANADEAAALLRESGRSRLGDLAQALECPFGWDDVVLPDSLRCALDDFLYEARVRTTFWEDRKARRLFPQGRGLFALMSGPPGTGKTMAAQAIAASLDLDLFRISLSAVVSKYIGETSKNLQQIFARAKEMEAILLFDEADTLFSRRTEGKEALDHYANMDINYLLQAVETHDGIVLLATNRKGAIDPAFLRRIRYMLDFPKPGPGERRAIWGRLVGELSGAGAQAPLSEELDRLAASIEATGAQIKNAVLTGLFAARREGAPIGLAHLLRGLERELVKEGRALSDRDRERLLNP